MRYARSVRRRRNDGVAANRQDRGDGDEEEGVKNELCFL